MTEQERLELEAHAEELERAALSLLEDSFKARYSHERTHASGASTGYEAAAIWLRGFLRRHTDTAEQEQAAEEDRAANEGRESAPPTLGVRE